MESKLQFGQFISKKRKEQKLTQKEFAARLYVTESAVSKWERGISYPDISLVSDICRELKISEHELITASEDASQRKLEKQANSFIHIIRTYSNTFYILYAISLTICYVANVITSQHLTWFFLVLTAEMIAFSLFNLPVIIDKYKGIATIVGSYLSINLTLLTCCIYSKGRWFFILFVCISAGYVILFLPYILKESLKPMGIGKHKAF